MKIHVLLMMFHISIRLNNCQAIYYKHLCRHYGWVFHHNGNKYWIEV